MIERVTDRAYLAFQYGDSEKLRIRLEAHEKYSERAEDWAARILAHLSLDPGNTLLDVGSGYGSIHPRLVKAGVQVVGLDLSLGPVREARQRATSDALPVRLFQADAQALPLHDASYDRGLASHMLFYVPDVERALREMRRVLRPSGRVCLTTNAADHSALLYDFQCRAAADLGYTPTAGPASMPFTLDHLPRVRSVFPNAELHCWPNAFLFPTADATLRFYASSRVDAVLERREDGAHRPPLLERVRAMIETVVAREGVFRLPKDASCFVATVEQ